VTVGLVIFVLVLALFIFAPMLDSKSDESVASLGEGLEKSKSADLSQDKQAKLLELEEALSLGQIDKDVFDSLKEEIQNG